MKTKSLEQLLQFQWWSHTLATSVFFIASTVFLLFAVEDYYHESQLLDISDMVSNQGILNGLPTHIQAYSIDEAPNFIKAMSKDLDVTNVLETQDPFGNIVHVTQNRIKGSGKNFFLVSDESKTKSIFRNIDKILLMLTPLVIVFLFLATLFSRRFTRKLHMGFTVLLRILKSSDNSDGLYKYSQIQSIKELSEFSLLFAKIWDEKLEILSREREGLEYLSHELRTPIQTAKATLELISIKHGHDIEIQRIDRSINRMTRLSNAILCLMETDTKPLHYDVSSIEICKQLIEEFSPLLSKKNQQIELILEPEENDKLLKATKEILETIISILLMNAIHHSDSRPILIYLNCDGIVIKNYSRQFKYNPLRMTMTNELENQSYGIGLVIGKRLSNLISMSLEVKMKSDGLVLATLKHCANTPQPNY